MQLAPVLHSSTPDIVTRPSWWARPPSQPPLYLLFLNAAWGKWVEVPSAVRMSANPSRVLWGKQCRGILPKARVAKAALKNLPLPYFLRKITRTSECINKLIVSNEENVCCHLKMLSSYDISFSSLSTPSTFPQGRGLLFLFNYLHLKPDSLPNC